MKKTIIIILSVLVLLITFITVSTVRANSVRNRFKFNSNKEIETDYKDFINSSYEDYYDYLNSHNFNYTTDQIIEIKAVDMINSTDLNAMILPNHEGRENVLETSDVGEITWEFTADVAGLYVINLDYYPIEGRGANIERTVLINGKVPYSGAKNIVLHRVWGSELSGDFKTDIFDNHIKPSQIEKPIWQTVAVKDSVGYVNENYYFYFKEGLNTITLKGENENVVLDKITIKSPEVLASYSEVKQKYDSLGYKKVNGEMNLVEAEHAKNTTSPTLYPIDDKDPSTSPNHYKKVRLNTIGGNNWRISGDKVTWDISVEETGLYEISMRVRQNIATGMTSGRNIYIDGKIPFKELENFTFIHDNNWRTQTLGTKNDAFLFYFEAGRSYELTMENSLGEYGSKIAQLEGIIENLSKIYREILKITGPEPDPNLDYQLTTMIPGLVGRVEKEKNSIVNLRKELVEISGSRSEKTGILDTVIMQLQDFVKKPSRIHRKLSAFNNNIASLGSLIIMLSDQPLQIDYFLIHAADAKLPKTTVNIFKSSVFKVRAFFSTFTTDYASIGKTNNEGGETINVWLTVGRDQANVLRKLIDENFTNKYGIQVDLKLVSGASLLPATLANKGPDVAMGVGSDVPVNYALRNASYDLSQFSDFEEVSKRFMDSGLVPFRFGGGTYALPEQQIFLMMFYRKDIFEEYGLPVPNTWDDVRDIIADLQNYNLEFYLPVPRTQGAVVNLAPNPVFSTMFLQNDGQFYIKNNTESGFNEELGPEIFERWTQYYTDYSFPVEANFVNRFRSGQMPLGITYYNTYNTLSVFAPEIRGKWEFLPVPGTKYIDEEGKEQVRRETVASSSGVMILNNSKKKDEAWEFVKWWTSAETQLRFGKEMEGILGAAARYTTANIEAFQSLPWRPNEREILMEQWEWVRGIPEVPGSYMTGRHLDNAFRKVINDKANPREVIYDYVQIINEEIKKKREEFKLD